MVDRQRGGRRLVTTHCARHPNVETPLRCGRCETPICPSCLVMTPVGARCPTCTRVRRHPAHEVGPFVYARAIGAAVALALFGGYALALIGRLIPFGYFLLVMALGYFAGEAVSRAANRRSGRGLQVVAGASVILAILCQQVIPFALRAPAMLLYGSVVGPLFAASALALIGNPLMLLVLALAVWLAASRL
ncbi:MAG: hypothetical protein HYY04_17205 [Chloroflexi bacterium]|nr:hypothetical protein [Chloroflexota bacterium]